MFCRVSVPCLDARCRHPFPSFDCHRRPACTGGRPAFRRCRVAAPQTSTTDPPSRPQACSQPAPRRAFHPRFVHPFHEPGTRSAFRHHPEAIHAAASPLPLYRFHQWLANLRVLEVTEIKTLPYVPLSHPFVERLIGTLRRECLDRTLFWTTTDLEAKLLDFQQYYNEHRTNAGRQGHPPVAGVNADRSRANLRCYRWQKHYRGLYQTPMAA